MILENWSVHFEKDFESEIYQDENPLIRDPGILLKKGQRKQEQSLFV